MHVSVWHQWATSLQRERVHSILTTRDINEPPATSHTRHHILSLCLSDLSCTTAVCVVRETRNICGCSEAVILTEIPRSAIKRTSIVNTIADWNEFIFMMIEACVEISIMRNGVSWYSYFLCYSFVFVLVDLIRREGGKEGGREGCGIMDIWMDGRRKGSKRRFGQWERDNNLYLMSGGDRVHFMYNLFAEKDIQALKIHLRHPWVYLICLPFSVWHSLMYAILFIN